MAKGRGYVAYLRLDTLKAFSAAFTESLDKVEWQWRSIMACVSTCVSCPASGKTRDWNSSLNTSLIGTESPDCDPVL